MKFLISLLLLFASYSYAEAYLPAVIEQKDLHDITKITDPELSQFFYGKLTGYPHTYEIRSKKSFELHVEVLLPEMEGVSTDLSGIIIKETGFRGRVSEVTRLLGKDAAWAPMYEPWGGDRYRKGGTYTAQLDPGVYRIEVSTPQNESPYVLKIGSRAEWGAVGYWDMVKRIAAVKKFYNKPSLLVIESPLVYGPLMVLLMCGGLYLYLRRKRSA